MGILANEERKGLAMAITSPIHAAQKTGDDQTNSDGRICSDVPEEKIGSPLANVGCKILSITKSYHPSKIFPFQSSKKSGKKIIIKRDGSGKLAATTCGCCTGNILTQNYCGYEVDDSNVFFEGELSTMVCGRAFCIICRSKWGTLDGDGTSRCGLHLDNLCGVIDRESRDDAPTNNDDDDDSASNNDDDDAPTNNDDDDAAGNNGSRISATPAVPRKPKNKRTDQRKRIGSRISATPAIPPTPKNKRTDPRKRIGGYVEAQAMLITNKKEADRRYGSQSKTKVLRGKVINVVTEICKGRSQASCFIISNWELDEKARKRVKINLRSVKKCSYESPLSDVSVRISPAPLVKETSKVPDPSNKTPSTTPTPKSTSENSK